MQHKTILAQGGTVHYWIARNESVSDCIVFTHGVTADHTMFEKQIPYFSDNYIIVLWDVKVKAYCKEWAKQIGYPLHFIKQAKHFANGDNPEQVNKEIENFIIETVHKERKNYVVL